VPTEETNKATREEWRELGFFYDRDDPSKEWRVRGSRSGLLAFASILSNYSRNPRSHELSEHDHFGPYMYLTIGTWRRPEITDYWICGSPEDLSRLSQLVQDKVAKAHVGDVLSFRKLYAPDSAYELILELSDDQFDPAVADEACW
jgi:hypothetical protein